MPDALLRLVDLPWPPYADHGIVQKLEPVDQDDLRRSINGTLNAIGLSHNKFRTVIEAQDADSPNFDGIFSGQPTAVECLCQLSTHIPAGNSMVTLARDPVAGSITAQFANGNAVTISDISGRDITIATQAEDVFIRYRPRLDMMVESWSLREDEWAAVTGWTMILTEV